MKFYVGVTDNEWFVFLAGLKPDEVNFWRPKATRAFRAIELGAPFHKEVTIRGGDDSA